MAALPGHGILRFHIILPLLLLPLLLLLLLPLPFGGHAIHRSPSAALLRRAVNRERVRSMFTFAYDQYMEHAYPLDELNPIYCSGRSVDLDQPDNININDVLGNYSLTLIDTLDTLAIMGNRTAFADAVARVVQAVSFDQDSVVQVFEATIRVLGGLLSAHMIAQEPTFNMSMPWFKQPKRKKMQTKE